MATPPMPLPMTPEQLAMVSQWMPPEEAMAMAALLGPQALQHQLDHIQDDRRAEIVVSVTIVAVLAVLAVALRLVCRRQMKVPVSYDDYTIIAGLVFTLGLCLCQAYSVEFGSGRHFIATGLSKFQTNVKIQYAFAYLWSVAIACIKISILIFYRRLFPQRNTSAKWRLCHLLLCIASVALGVISIFGTAFQCTPVAFTWDRTIPGGHCIDFRAFSRFTAIMNIVTDILILAMPMPIVWSLHLEKSKKIGICALFLLGGFVCFTTIIRFVYLETLWHGMDQTWDNVNIAIWSCVEPCIAIVSACLPIMGPLLRTHLVSFSTLAFRSRSKKPSHNSSGYTGESASRKSKRGFGSLGEGKLASKGGPDEEMGIPLKDKKTETDIEIEERAP
ncbi:MAG: hypothetical protein Q9208_003306 [Pyrenodesmia sp. 3 TL-2023]